MSREFPIQPDFFLSTLNENLTKAGLPILSNAVLTKVEVEDTETEFDSIYIAEYFLLYLGQPKVVFISNDYSGDEFDPYKMTVVMSFISKTAIGLDMDFEIGKPIVINNETGQINVLVPSEPEEAPVTE